MSTSKPKSGPSEQIKHPEKGVTAFVEKKETPKYDRTQERTYTPKQQEKKK